MLLLAHLQEYINDLWVEIFPRLFPDVIQRRFARPAFSIVAIRWHSLQWCIMPKVIPASERILLARSFIQQAYDLPVPSTGLGKSDFSYIANVKDLLRQAKDMVKFIPQTAGVSVEMKEEVKKIYEELEQANRAIL